MASRARRSVSAVSACPLAGSPPSGCRSSSRSTARAVFFAQIPFHTSAADSIAAATQAKAAAYRQEVCSADAAVAAGAADTACDPSGAYGAAVQALQMMRTKRAARLPKKHGNMAL